MKISQGSSIPGSVLSTPKQLLEKEIEVIENDINLLYSGFVEKRTFITYNSYYLAIMNNLKMVRIKSEEPEKRVEIEIPLDLSF